MNFSLAPLPELLIELQARSPNEFKTGGSGLQIWYGRHQTPFGECLIAMTPRGICNLHFLDAPDPGAAAQALRSAWPQADLIQDQQMTQGICDRMFESITANSQPLKLWVRGTDFQMQVWRALLKIPFGGTTTYQELAAEIGRPTAARAVGSAVGSNPVGYLIPCHRVIRASGELGGFRWGLERKTMMLGWEASYCKRSCSQEYHSGNPSPVVAET